MLRQDKANPSAPVTLCVTVTSLSLLDLGKYFITSIFQNSLNSKIIETSFDNAGNNGN